MQTQQPTATYGCIGIFHVLLVHRKIRRANIGNLMKCPTVLLEHRAFVVQLTGVVPTLNSPRLFPSPCIDGKIFCHSQTPETATATMRHLSLSLSLSLSFICTNANCIQLNQSQSRGTFFTYEEALDHGMAAAVTTSQSQLLGPAWRAAGAAACAPSRRRRRA